MSHADDKEIKEIFSLFDRNGDGYISTSDVGPVLRALGKVPTESEVSELLKEVGPEKIDVNKVKLLLEKAKREIDDKEVREALKLFDPDNKGTIQTDQLKTVLTSMGERLDAKDLDPVLQQLDQDGFINIEKLMGILMPRAGGN